MRKIVGGKGDGKRKGFVGFMLCSFLKLSFFWGIVCKWVLKSLGYYLDFYIMLERLEEILFFFESLLVIILIYFYFF